MIEEELTFQKYGYRSIDLRTQSARKLVVRCDCCKKIREVNKQAYRDLCQSCAQHRRRSKFDNVTPEFLVENYVNKKLSMEDVGKLIGCSYVPINNLLLKYDIHIRTKAETVECIKKKLTGRKRSESELQNCRAAGFRQRGSNSIQWKGGISPLRNLLYNCTEYRNWRTAIFIRDKGICQDCLEKPCVEVHHIKRFSLLYEEFLKKYSRFSPITDKEILLRLAAEYQPFWDLSNGKALCTECHAKTKGGPKKI
jgi:5-methylcytosine-specific restriction endonuclease McrA